MNAGNSKPRATPARRGMNQSKRSVQSYSIRAADGHRLSDGAVTCMSWWATRSAGNFSVPRRCPDGYGACCLPTPANAADLRRGVWRLADFPLTFL